MLRAITLLAVLCAGCPGSAAAERQKTAFSPVQPGINLGPRHHLRLASALGFGIGAAMACGVDKAEAARVAELGTATLGAVSRADRERLVQSLKSGRHAVWSGETNCRTMLPMFRQMRQAFGS